MPRERDGEARREGPGGAHARRVPAGQHDEFKETRIRTRRAIRETGEVVYGADVETTRIVAAEENPELVTEEHAGAGQAACGCLIEGNLKPRFHRDGTMVCQNHYYYCGVCGKELLPLQLVVVEKRVYCRPCGEDAIDEVLWMERTHPGCFEKAVVAHLAVVKRELRNQRWKRAFSWLFGQKELGE